MRRFTGWHMTAILVGFFGVVIAVNMTMAVFASRTFGGMVVENSYVASQRYNGWLEEARRERELAWDERISRIGDRIVIDAATSAGPLDGARIAGLARHPLGGAEPVALSFAELGDGRYRSLEPLPEGRWIVRIEIAQGGRSKRLVADLS